MSTNGSTPLSDTDLERDAEGPGGPVTLEALSEQIRNLAKHQLVLAKLVRGNTDHVLKLQHNVDPLTWRRRAAVIFAGAVAGGGLMYMLLHTAVALASQR